MRGQGRVEHLDRLLDRDGIRDIAVNGTKLVKQLADAMPETEREVPKVALAFMAGRGEYVTSSSGLADPTVSEVAFLAQCASVYLQRSSYQLLLP